MIVNFSDVLGVKDELSFHFASPNVLQMIAEHDVILLTISFYNCVCIVFLRGLEIVITFVIIVLFLVIVVF